MLPASPARALAACATVAHAQQGTHLHSWRLFSTHRKHHAPWFMMQLITHGYFQIMMVSTAALTLYERTRALQ